MNEQRIHSQIALETLEQRLAVLRADIASEAAILPNIIRAFDHARLGDCNPDATCRGPWGEKFDHLSKIVRRRLLSLMRDYANVAERAEQIREELSR